jgi:LPS export ABC transporter protein LptC
MSINVFFAVLLGGLLAMFAYFKPSTPQNKNTKEVPKIELESFVVYEISARGVDRFFEGNVGKRFNDRYEVSSAKFSNNSKQLFESIRADEARYKDDFLTLTGNVHYVREDGLEFRSAEGTFDQNISVIRTKGPFVITQNHNRIDGTRLYYNTDQDTVTADAVRGSYQLD